MFNWKEVLRERSLEIPEKFIIKKSRHVIEGKSFKNQ
jgi:hypothetical protein